MISYSRMYLFDFISWSGVWKYLFMWVTYYFTVSISSQYQFQNKFRLIINLKNLVRVSYVMLTVETSQI